MLSITVQASYFINIFNQYEVKNPPEHLKDRFLHSIILIFLYQYDTYIQFVSYIIFFSYLYSGNNLINNIVNVPLQ